MAWKFGVGCKVGVCSFHVINLFLYYDPPNHPWMVSFVYGLTNWNNKDAFWYELEQYGSNFDGPWLCLGDFNALLDQSEKWGGRPVGSSNSGAMKCFVTNMGLIDLGFVENKYTWCNGRQGRGFIQERLDHGLANREWRCLFPNATVKHLPRIISDHSPLLLDTLGETNSGPRPFRFKSFWTQDRRSFWAVQEAWRHNTSGSPAYTLCHHLKATKEALRSWNREVFGAIQTKISDLQQQLSNI